MVCVGEHSFDHVLGVALLTQDRRPVLRVLVERRVDLVVEVVQERDDSPALLVLPVGARVPAHGGLDGERVTEERLALRVARERVPGLIAGRLHGPARIAPSRTTARAPATVMPQTAVADAVMESFVIEGGQPLTGSLRPAGNKNRALPILAASVLTSEPVVLSNVPRIIDVETMLELLADIGVDVDWVGGNEVRVHAANVSK